MAETNVNPVSAVGSNCFKEAVCIDAGRIYDSCSDKDCISDLQVHFTDTVQPIIDQCCSVKCKKVEILNVYLDVEPVPFNKGFYSVDLTFFFLCKLNAYATPLSAPVPVEGMAIFSKKVILFGSEGSVKSFSSTDSRNSSNCFRTNMPVATVQAVDPISLACKLVDYNSVCCDNGTCLPVDVCNCFEGNFAGVVPVKTVLITLGLFTIVQIERSVQMMIPAYDFCIPDKESVFESDDPCEIFRKIKFPTGEFFPPKLNDVDCEE